MYTTLLATALTALSLFTPTLSLGINCRGSSSCSPVIGDLLSIQSELQKIDPRLHFNNGEHIANDGAITCFYQKTANGGTAGEALTHVTNLIQHGCTVCGSDPTEPGNNVDTGELTCNYVF